MNHFLQVICCCVLVMVVTDVKGSAPDNDTKTSQNEAKSSLRSPIAIHYETVDVVRLFNNQTASISRVSIADEKGKIIYDKLVKPLQVVVDYRTNITGITENDLLGGDDFYNIRLNIIELMSWRILIGYKIGDFLGLMKVRHPLHLLRDTSYFTRCSETKSNEDLNIKALAKQFLNIDLLNNSDTKEKAILTMKLYRKFQNQWEMYVSDRIHASSIAYGLDCETLFGINKDGNKVEMLVRISIVDFGGILVYDKLFKPIYQVTDYQTNITGLTKDNFTNAEYLSHSLKKIRSILKGNTIVGHELSHHLKFLGVHHSFPLRRDTSSYRPFLLAIPNKQTPSLKELAQVLLNTTIQNKYRDTVENAETAIMLYYKFKREWDEEVRHMYQIYHSHRKLQGKRRMNSPVAINYGRVLSYNMDRKRKLIGRVTIIDENKNCIYDKFIKPIAISTIANCYTKNTGITFQNLNNGTSKSQIRQELISLMEDRIIIGYNLYYLFSYFRLNIDIWNQRDVSLYTEFYSSSNTVQTVYKITKQFLNISLHRNASTMTRASVFMDLYSKYKDDWDISIAQMVTNMKTNALNKVIVPKQFDYTIGDPISLQYSLILENNLGVKSHNIIGRIVLVDKEGNCVYNKFIKPNFNRVIVDYRTNITGIRPDLLVTGEKYYTVVSEITRIIQNKIIIGEQLFKCIRLLPHRTINYKLIRDIKQFSIFKEEYKGFFSLGKICSKHMGFILKHVTNPVERAQALMLIYLKYSEKWELEVQRKISNHGKKRFTSANSTYRPTFWYNRTKRNTFWAPTSEKN